ncbi:response regulator transcription factor [Nocardioides donggukensis]|uniref:Response regulator transcription factor n=1 Tax=Nocardioides donggukensis TaxID=2774019 RepID=A0A927PZN6_9ACTN|nr:response regulator transcription factor [Nocardioides donggukensis]MBD8869475.1 response regulator transcription factor [Nocardioides donggukensis]
MGGSRLTAVVVEDDADLRGLLTEVLTRSGFSVTAAADASTGLEAVRRTDPELVTLDLSLPDFDGMEVCRVIRAESDAYILILSGRTGELDKLLGLETGADDYLTKPFSPRELAARVAALMRRPRRLRTESESDRTESNTYRSDGLVVDTRKHTAVLDGVELELTRTEFGLLAALMREPDRAWSRADLLQEVWGSEWGADGHLVEVHIGNLRRKLGDDAQRGRFVRTVRGVGYRLGEDPVHT